jgi:hypothetical protein
LGLQVTRARDLVPDVFDAVAHGRVERVAVALALGVQMSALGNGFGRGDKA